MGSYSHEREHLRFKRQARKKGLKTDVWEVTNGKWQQLARVVYRPGWRKYVTRFAVGAGIIDFDSKCHIQAAKFCEEQTAKLKATWKQKGK